MKIKNKQLKLSHYLSNQISLLVIIMILLLAVITSISPQFLTWQNMRNLLMQNAITGIVAVGMTIVMISGGIDLSVGNQLSFIGCFLALLINSGVPDGWAVLIVIALSGLMSFFTGVIIANTSAQPFIITLGLMSVYKALALITSNGSDMPLRGFKWLGQTQIFGIILTVWIFLIMYLIVGFVLKYTRFGRNVYSLGSNEQASYISGINVKKLKISIYTLNGLIVGLAAAVMLSRLGSAVPTMGDGYEMNAIASCAIGGITLAGGTGSVFGAFLGVLFLGIVRNGLNMMRVPSFFQYLVNGIIIIIAVLLSNYKKRS